MEVEKFDKSQETPKETVEERQEKTEKFLRSAIIMKHKNILQDIYRYMMINNLTLDQIKQEVEEKKCKLTATRREFISSFKLDFIKQLFDDIKEKHNGNNQTKV